MNAVSVEVGRDRTQFFGRDRERALLRDYLERGKGLLMLTGPSGIGKTRLTRQVAMEEAHAYAGGAGVFFCNLTGCQSAEELEAVVARVLDIAHKQGDALAQAIAERGRILLILDNIDAGAPLLRDVIGIWLDRCEALQMIATSIVPLELVGEVRIEVGPLDAEDGVALYLDRAHQAWGDRVFSEAELRQIEELVKRLDGIPLAIELAAARIRVLPPGTLLARIDQRFELLRSSAPGRHGSFLEALKLTWELLRPREQEFLSRASVFEGGFTYEAAEEILGADASEGEVLDLLDSLRGKALLQIDDGDPPRFHLFESVKEFAHRQLIDDGLLAETERRHDAYFLRWSGYHLERFERRQARDAIDWLKEERANLFAVHHRNLESNPAVAASVGLALAKLVLMEGHPPSEAHLSEIILGAARRSEDPRLIIRALATRADVLKQRGQVAEAFELTEEALALARVVGDRTFEYRLLLQASMLHANGSETDAALIEHAIEVGREEGEPLIEGLALMVRGRSLLRESAFDEAESCYVSAREIFREHGMLGWEVSSLTILSRVWGGQGRLREARKALQDALGGSRQLGNRTSEAYSLTNLSELELADGDLESAERHAAEGLERHRELGTRMGEGLARGILGIIALERGQLDLAQEHLIEAEALLRDCGFKSFHAWLLSAIAVMEARRHRIFEARRSLEAARDHFSSVGDELGLLRAAVIEGAVEIAEAEQLRPDDRQAHALVEKARARLAVARAAPQARCSSLIGIIRLVEQDLRRWESRQRSSGFEEPGEGLWVGPNGDWFKLPGKPKVNLRRRIAICRMLDALAQKRLEEPGAGLSPHELFEVGWPGVDLHPETAIKRVYLGVWTLRDLGLAGVLLHQTDGYLLDPALPLLRQGG